MAESVIPSSREAGCEGGTIFLGKGVSVLHRQTLLGIPLESDIEMTLSLVTAETANTVFEAVKSAAKLEQEGHGIIFMVDVSRIAGVCHMCPLPESRPSHKEVNYVKKHTGTEFDLIVTIVDRGLAEKVIEASQKAGAKGGTTLSGRGTGIHEHTKLFGFEIEPEKEVVFTLIERNETHRVLAAIEEETELDRPGKGIAFVLPVERVAGIAHLHRL